MSQQQRRDARIVMLQELIESLEVGLRVVVDDVNDCGGESVLLCKLQSLVEAFEVEIRNHNAVVADE